MDGEVVAGDQKKPHVFGVRQSRVSGRHWEVFRPDSLGGIPEDLGGLFTSVDMAVRAILRYELPVPRVRPDGVERIKYKKRLPRNALNGELSESAKRYIERNKSDKWRKASKSFSSNPSSAG